MSSSRSTRSRADQFADLDEPAAPRDLDPEDEFQLQHDTEDDSSQDEHVAANAGREHYQNVGKSRLRKGQSASLGPQYAGSTTSRRNIDANGTQHDPFEGYDSDASDQSEGLTSSRVANGHRDGMDDDGDSVAEEEEEDASTQDTSMSEADEEDDEPSGFASGKTEDRAHLRKLMNEGHKTVAASIAEANRADAEKGKAVKSQREAFDKLLNGRIRLQQALVATNSMTIESKDTTTATDDAAIRAAETAALSLWNTLEDLRQTMDEARTGTKRKTPAATTDTTNIEMWRAMEASETINLPHRRKVLQKWSAKTQTVTTQPQSVRLNNAPRQRTIMDVLEEQLGDKERLVKRTRMPRSCAPVQASKRVSEDPEIFDDADFYGVMLKELLERRKVDAASNAEADQVADQYRAARDAKTKKNVDTKASKGRKLRYAVHEKLQNFMAPENRGTWEDRQIDELFGSLLGRRMALAEDEPEDDEGVREEEALMLFRS